MVELIILRHAETTKDTPYVKVSLGEGNFEYRISEGPLLKGSSDDIHYRLSDFGVLQAHETATRIRQFYLKAGTAPKVVLCHSPLLRATETEEILKTVLDEAQPVEISELIERGFGGIEGHKIPDIEAALRDNGTYPNKDFALVYSDTFDYLEQALRDRGVDVKHADSESFKGTLERRHYGLRYILDKFGWADYIVAVMHQVSGVFTMAAFDLLGMSPEELDRYINSIDVTSPESKMRAVPLRNLDSSRFTRVGLVEHRGATWRVQFEQNDRGHLESLATAWSGRYIPEPTEQEKERISRIRRSIAPFYESRGMPVEPQPERKTPFEGLKISSYADEAQEEAQGASDKDASPAGSDTEE
jgi:broad specificity phosphatase PhoE